MGKLVLAAIVGAGLLLLEFPRDGPPVVDAVESVAPPIQTTFLTEFERATRTEMHESIERAQAELARLRELEQDVDGQSGR